MKSLKVLATSISAGFEKFVNQIENHEAIVDSAIAEAQTAYSRAKVQLTIIKKDHNILEDRKQKLGEQIALWEQRARITGATDKEKAIQCLYRKKNCESELNRVANQLKDQIVLQTALQNDLNNIHNKIEELKKRRSEFIARQSCCDAIRAANASDFTVLNDIDDVFGRWEVKLANYEIDKVVEDDLEQEFIEQEQKSELEAELNALMVRGG